MLVAGKYEGINSDAEGVSAKLPLAVDWSLTCALRWQAGKYEGWLPDLFLGKRLWGGTGGLLFSPLV